MELFNLDDMIGGWFIGDFKPSVFRSSDFEIAIKKYRKGQVEQEHFHKVAKEFTVVVSGEIKMFNTIYVSGDIIRVDQYDSTSFEAISETITVVVKIPSALDDKFIKGYEDK